MTSHVTERDQLAAVLALHRWLPAAVVVEVTLAYDQLCDPTGPPPPPRPTTVGDPAQTIGAVHGRLLAGIVAAGGVREPLTIGIAARHLANALNLLGSEPATL